MDLQDGFGVTPDIRTRMKIAMFYVRDLMFLIIWAGIIFMISDIFPPDMQLETVCFWVVGIGYGVWLVCPSLGNHGKRNWELLIYDFFPKKHDLKASIMGFSLNKRLKGCGSDDFCSTQW